MRDVYEQQLHQCHLLTLLLAQLLVTAAVRRHVQQSIAVKLHCSTACQLKISIFYPRFKSTRVVNFVTKLSVQIRWQF